MGRAPCCDKSKVKRGPWSPEEDATLKNYLNKHGSTDNWIALPTKAGLNRCGKSCRLRWLNYLRPNIKRGGFTEEEDDVICTLYSSIGSRWSVIASQLPGRTDNDVKNYWNTKLKKKPLTSARRSNHVATRNTNDFNRTQLSASVPPKIETSHHVPESTPSCFGETLPYLKQDFGPSCDPQSSHVKPIVVAGVGNSESNSFNNPIPSQEVSSLPISSSFAQLDQYPIYHCTLWSGYDGFKTNNSEFVGFGFESTPPAGDHYLLDGFGY